MALMSHSRYLSCTAEIEKGLVLAGGRRRIAPLVGLESILTCHLRLLWQLCIHVICVILLDLRLRMCLSMCLSLCLLLLLLLLLLSMGHGRQMDLLLPSLLFLLLLKYLLLMYHVVQVCLVLLVVLVLMLVVQHMHPSMMRIRRPTDTDADTARRINTRRQSDRIWICRSRSR